MRAPRGWGPFALVAAGVLAADQVTKFLAVKYLTRAFAIAGADSLPGEVSAYFSMKGLGPLALSALTVVPSFWSHRYAENPGAAWSFAATWPDAVRVPFFHAVSVVAIALILAYFSRLAPGQLRLRHALALVLGGALGNLADRLLRGYVIDFIDWHLADPDWLRPALHWPTFNVADAGITAGVLLILFDSIIDWRAQRRAAAPQGAQGGA